jgi:predicted O-methyltransferase YrrM
MKKLEKEITTLKANADGLAHDLSKTSTRNVARYQRFARQLGLTEAAELQVWAERLGLKTNQRAISYLANSICRLESLLSGRLATSIADVTLRALVARAAPGTPRRILEIGTLFGIGAAALYEAARFDGRGLRLTLLDPLDGYYGTDNLDILTGLPINEEILRRNLELAGIDREHVDIIKLFSSNPEAERRAAAFRYDLLVIDGDHSYEGVKLDFDVYSKLVRPGGFIVIDDYASADWPDVTRFVDESVKPHPHLEFVGAHWRTAVLRVVSSLE